MSRAYLIIGGNTHHRQEKISELYAKFKPQQKPTSDPDTQILTSQTSIKIEDVRNLGHFLSLRPYLQPPKMAIISEADKLTFEAQGALLKLLEEPPGETIILLTVQASSQLLPTIISRCLKILLPSESEIALGAEEIEEAQKNLAIIMASGPGRRIKAVEPFTNREEALLFCQKQLALWREILLKEPTQENARVVREIQKTIKHLRANVNFRLAVENLLLFYPYSEKKE